MASIPKVTTGTYDGRSFELIHRVVHFEGNEDVRRVEGYLIGFENGDVKYVLDYDPLLEFEPIRREDEA